MTEYFCRNVTRLEAGPATITLQDNENVVLEPTDMIQIPPQYYCMIRNPVDRAALHKTAKGQLVRLKYGELEVRVNTEISEEKKKKGKSIYWSEFVDPFPLYPGEILESEIKVMIVNNSFDDPPFAATANHAQRHSTIIESQKRHR